MGSSIKCVRGKILCGRKAQFHMKTDISNIMYLSSRIRYTHHIFYGPVENEWIHFLKEACTYEYEWEYKYEYEWEAPSCRVYPTSVMCLTLLSGTRAKAFTLLVLSYTLSLSLFSLCNPSWLRGWHILGEEFLRI